MQIRSAPRWESIDPRTRQRGRWLVLARVEAEAAESLGEPHIAEAFRIVVATLLADHLVPPISCDRVTLKGREALRGQAIELGRAGLSSRSVARAVGVPYITVYSWLRRAGVAQTRDQWRERVKVG